MNDADRSMLLDLARRCMGEAQFQLDAGGPMTIDVAALRKKTAARMIKAAALAFKVLEATGKAKS